MNPKLCRADHLETGNKHGTSSKLATDNNNNKSVVSFVIHFVVFTCATADESKVTEIQGKEPNEAELDAVQ